MEARIEKVWKVNTKGNIFLLGAQCKSEAMKGEIMRNKRNLGRSRIYIDDDLTRTERKIRDKVREKARELREDGKKAIVIR